MQIPDIISFLPFLVIPAVIFLKIKFVSKQRKALRQAWSKIAQEYRLELSEKPSGLQALTLHEKLQGTIKSSYYQVDLQAVGSGKNKTTYTRFQGKFKKPLGLGLGIYKEVALLSSIAKTFGSKDIQTGDKSFDSRYVIKGEQEYQVMSYLNSSRKEAVEQLFSEGDKINLSDERVERMVRGKITDHELLKSHLDAIIAAVTTLER